MFLRGLSPHYFCIFCILLFSLISLCFVHIWMFFLYIYNLNFVCLFQFVLFCAQFNLFLRGLSPHCHFCIFVIFVFRFILFCESDVTYGQVWWAIFGSSALHLSIQSAHTHSSEHTHREHTQQWAAIYAAAPGEQLGVRCLAQGHLSRGIEGGESTVH